MEETIYAVKQNQHHSGTTLQTVHIWPRLALTKTTGLAYEHLHHTD